MIRPLRCLIMLYATAWQKLNVPPRFVCDHRVPVLRLHADEQVVVDDAGVVHQDVDRRPVLLDRFDARFGASSAFVTSHWYGLGRAAGRVDFCDQALGRCLAAAVDERDLGPLGGERLARCRGRCRGCRRSRSRLDPSTACVPFLSMRTPDFRSSVRRRPVARPHSAIQLPCAAPRATSRRCCNDALVRLPPGPGCGPRRL